MKREDRLLFQYFVLYSSSFSCIVTGVVVDKVALRCIVFVSFAAPAFG